MKTFIRFTVLILMTAFPAAFSSAASQVSDGQVLFNQYCSLCHGEGAMGQDPASPQGGWREDGSLIAPALNGSAHAWHHGPDVLYGYVKDGSVDPESPMPAFGDQLNDEQIRAIIGYFQSLWPEKIRKLYQEWFPGSLE